MGSVLLESGEWIRSLEALDKAQALDANDPELHNTRAQALYRLGRANEAVDHLETALRLKPRFKQARLLLIKLYNDAAGYKQALEHIAIAEKHYPSDDAVLSRKAYALAKLTRFGESIATHEKLVASFPDDPVHLSNLANAYRNVGRFEEAERNYWRALELAPDSDKIYSNYLASMHYNPAHSAQDLYEAHRQWDSRFGPNPAPIAPEPEDRFEHRRLRIGMVSAGFRIHPVGQMITSAIEALPHEQFELFAYSMSDQDDALTERMRNRVDHWLSITHLSESRLSERIRQDNIDILLDLCGHTEGSRLRAFAARPAPLQVKWVGGLINTTGLASMDYLISDKVETPEGVDDWYVEKLIRMPNDYICYMPRGNAPELTLPPVSENGYITFGCFNNPSKLNEELLDQWIKLLHEVPDSRLFLKGMQFDSKEFQERLLAHFEHGAIPRERLILEGHSNHYTLLESYNRVDIALDCWPYSGGLTTCEALLMGVPVVTLPGPSFAGRHSASHLTHAGLPELVAESWEQYHSLALELASDPDNLALIRRSLRQQLKASPVCDYKRFAGHLATALRGIWQRYCRQQPPAALHFNREGQACFEGDMEPIGPALRPEAANDADGNSGFPWQLEGRVVAIDNGAKLFRDSGFDSLRALDAFTVVGFDPLSEVAGPERFAPGQDSVQLFPHASLGDGRPATLYACLDPAMSATLKPLPDAQLGAGQARGARVLAELPINTVALDHIEGLGAIDWLVLDHRADNIAILDNGARALRDTLLLQVRAPFQHSHERQSSLAELEHWAKRHDFRFYRLNDPTHASQFPEDCELRNRQASELSSADALFIPSQARLAALEAPRRMKLAFLLHTVFGIHDLCHAQLQAIDPALAARYLESLSVGTGEKPRTAPAPTPAPANPGDTVQVPDAPFMSPGEADLFRRCLEQATSYFEYGSGGSTVWAVERGLTVRGVESDHQWVGALKERLGEPCQVDVVDIGPTKEWGFPISMEHQERFPDYSLAIDRHDANFDLILVDGRFRVACAMSAIRHCLARNAPVDTTRIFIHDFWNRPQYHVVLNFLEPLQQCESAGVFRIKPDVKLEQVDQTWREYARVPG
nr:tetratricopeptide repeat protein [Parahaliea mediterranea]